MSRLQAQLIAELQVVRRLGQEGVLQQMVPCDVEQLLASRTELGKDLVLQLIAAGGNAYYLAKFAGIFGLDMQDIGAQQTGLTKDEFKARLVAAGQSTGA